ICMTSRIMTFIVLTLFFMLIDFYLYQAILTLSKDWSAFPKSLIRYGFWAITGISVVALGWFTFADPYKYAPGIRSWIVVGLFGIYLSKIFGILIVFIDDIQRGIRWV